MRIGLVDVDSKIPNLALMKISAYHKTRGDDVEFHMPIARYDRIYAAKVFDFTPDYRYFPADAEVVRGGSGYDLAVELPDEIVQCFPDYSLYNCDYAIGFTTRGCIRRCPFCVVPIKEGGIRVAGDIYDFWNGQKRLMLLDNNLTALPDQFERICKQLIAERVQTDFSQGLDIRLITEEMAQLLKMVRRWKRIHFAFDSVALEQQVRRGIEILTKYINPHDLSFYVLIGYDSTPEEDLFRVELLRSYRISPFVMPFRKSDPYQRRFARWVNMKAIFASVSWEEYRGGAFV